MENIADVESRPLHLSLQILRDITANFSKDRVIGQGGFGVVYKGTFGDGEHIAVRKLYPVGEVDDKQFQDEIASLGRIKHQNILRLIGYCNEKQEVLLMHNGRHVIASKTDRALCSEYMQNGSLNRHISDTSCGLDWHTRYKIIKGICQGVGYLRECLNDPILHLDLKPQNILLDQDMTAKVADFGLHRLFGERNVRQMGTVAYMAPEFVEKQVISDEFDLFSLGIIIMELMTGNKPGYNDVYSDKFSELVCEKWRERLQKTLNGMSVERYCQQVTKCLEIALKCMAYDRHERPSIVEIMNRLEEIETLIPEEVRAVQNRFDSRKTWTLDVYPQELYFPFILKGRKDTTSCSLQLKNRGGNRVAFILVANSPKRYMIKKPLCGVVPPMSTCTLTLTKLKQTPSTSSDSSDFFTLYSTALGQYDLLDVEKDYTHYNNFFKDSKEYADKVHVVKLKVICDRPAAKPTGSSPEDPDRVSPRNCNDGNFFALKPREEKHDWKIL